MGARSVNRNQEGVTVLGGHLRPSKGCQEPIELWTVSSQSAMWNRCSSTWVILVVVLQDESHL